MKRFLILVACASGSKVRFLTSSSASPPRVIPLALTESASIIYGWSRAVETAPHRVVELQASRRMYQAKSPLGTLGSIGVIYGKSVHSVALLEQMDDERTILWDVCTSPFADGTRAGTVLLEAMVKAQPNITLGHTLHPRWKVARAFYI